MYNKYSLIEEYTDYSMQDSIDQMITNGIKFTE